MRACVRACVCDYPQSLRQAYERAIRTMLGHSDAFSHCQDPATILKSKQYGREPTRRPPLPARTPHSQHSERPRPFKRQRPFTQRHPLPWPVGRACQHHPPPWSLRRRSGPPPARPSPCPGRRLRPLCTPACRPPARRSMPVSWQGEKGSGVGPVTAAASLIPPPRGRRRGGRACCTPAPHNARARARERERERARARERESAVGGRACPTPAARVQQDATGAAPCGARRSFPLRVRAAPADGRAGRTRAARRAGRAGVRRARGGGGVGGGRAARGGGKGEVTGGSRRRLAAT